MKLTQGNITKFITVATLTKFLEANPEMLFFEGEWMTKSCVVAKFAQEKFGNTDLVVNGVELVDYDAHKRFSLKPIIQEFIHNIDCVANFTKISGKDIRSRLSQRIKVY